MESNYIVSARKYRPQTFDSVVGQKSITQTLKNAIKTNQLAHAYLFCGPRGVGKTTCARIFAKTINCQNLTSQVEACNKCTSCKAFNTNRSMNIHELDAASNNSVDDIRKLIEQVRIPPQIGKYSVYIIDEVHMLSAQAFNAFLKTLEEPPEHAIFILATTEKHKILPTILSRCQIFDFNRIQVQDIVDYLLKITKQEQITAEPEALNIIAQKADGGLRDALSFYDQIASFSDKNITYEKVIQSLNVLDYDYYFKLTDSFLKGEYIPTLLLFDDILNKGFDAHNFIIGLSSHFRDLLVAKDKETLQLLEVSHSIREKYKTQSEQTPVMFLIKALEIVAKADVEHKFAKNKRLHVELMLLALSQISDKLAKKYIPNKKNSNKVAQTAKNNTTKNLSENEKNKTTNGKIPSITSLLNGNNITEKSDKIKENEKNGLYKGQKKAEIEQVKKLWMEFAKDFEKSQPRLYTIFSEYDIKLDDQTIKIQVSNNEQKTKIEKIKLKIINYINKKLDTNINIEVAVSDKPIKPKKPYTDTEKYKFLTNKRKEVDDLKKQFKLSFD